MMRVTQHDHRATLDCYHSVCWVQELTGWFRVDAAEGLLFAQIARNDGFE